MEKNLKVTVILGYVFLFLFLVLLNTHSVSVNVLGHETFKLGNRTVMISNTTGTRILSNQDSIKKYINIKDELAFAIIDDSTNNPINKVFIDYLQMEGFTKYEQVIELLTQDTTANIIDQDIISDALFIKQKIFSDNEQIYYLYSRYNNCFPYYLRIRSVWATQQSIPKKVNDIFNSIKVN